jgi:hypothetical protein
LGNGFIESRRPLQVQWVGLEDLDKAVQEIKRKFNIPTSETPTREIFAVDL